MNGIYVTLMEIMLSSDEWVTAGFLAGEMNVSERSIKTYIAKINQSEKDLIISSRKGYRIDSQRAKTILENTDQGIPQTSKERVNYMITKLLTEDVADGEKTDLYEIGEELFVSYETIKKDLVKVKRKMMEFDLFLFVSKSYVTVEGNELDKRKLLSSILYEEFHNIMSLEVIENAFPGFDIELLKTIIQKQCKQYHYFVNEYALMNLVLDIIIGIYRIKNERTFGKPRKHKTKAGIREQELARNIADEIERCFDITYSPVELDELTIILLSYLMKMDYSKIDINNLDSVVGIENRKIVDKIRSFLKKNYFIHTDDKDFIIKFTLHIKNLLVRLQNGYSIKNPLLDHIKKNCPLIFDCAVGAANKLKELTDYELNEDEISYIALHIGSNLENRKSKNKILSCIILYPQYYDFSNKIIEELKNHYGTRLDIKTVITTIDQYDRKTKADLLITTVAVQSALPIEWVVVTPFLNEKDYSAIDDKIKKINARKTKARLKKHLMQISNPDFYCKNAVYHNKEEALRFMVDIMEKEGYVNQSFYEEVLDREKQSSTAFDLIAVPHSMKMNSPKTGMFILINQHPPIPWGEKSVNIVLLFAVNKDERAIFHEIFDKLITLLLDKQNLTRVLSSNSYIEFIESVIECFH